MSGNGLGKLVRREKGSESLTLISSTLPLSSGYLHYSPKNSPTDSDFFRIIVMLIICIREEGKGAKREREGVRERERKRERDRQTDRWTDR